jgi:hypothetical protein
VRRYKRNPHLLQFVRAEVPLSALMSNRLLPCSSPAATTMDSVTKCLSASLCRSWSFTELRSCSPTGGTSTFSTDEPQHRRCAGELSPHRRPTSSVHPRVHSLVRWVCRGPWMMPVFTFLPTVQPLAISAHATPRALCTIVAPGQVPCVLCVPCGQ